MDFFKSLKIAWNFPLSDFLLIAAIKLVFSSINDPYTSVSLDVVFNKLFLIHIVLMVVAL